MTLPPWYPPDLPFLRRDLLAVGGDDRDLKRALRRGSIVRIRHGAYMPREVWEGLDPVARHCLVAAAVYRQARGSVVFSHTTALALHGLPLWGVDLERVHTSRADGSSGRRDPGVTHHHAALPLNDLSLAQGLPTTTPLRACFELLAVTPGYESALVSTEAALHQGLFSKRDLEDKWRTMAQWPGLRHALMLARLASPLSASPGESRSLALMVRARVPRPIQQFPFVDEDGRIFAYGDFYWPELRCLVEFDGMVKYQGLLRPGETPFQAALREKFREDRIRELTDCRVQRWTWNDLARPDETMHRLKTFLGVREPVR